MFRLLREDSFYINAKGCDIIKKSIYSGTSTYECPAKNSGL